MARVTWTDAAGRDVKDVREYIARVSRTTADAMVRRLRGDRTPGAPMR